MTCLAFWMLLVTAALAARAAETPPAAQQDDATANPQILGVRVGFDGRYKVGLWTPVEVQLGGGKQALSGRVSVIVPDGDGVPSRVSTAPDQPCDVTAGGEATLQLFVRFGRVRSTLQVELEVDGRVVARRTFSAAAQSDEDHFQEALDARDLIVTVGPAATGAAEAIGLPGADAGRHAVVARLGDLGHLPTQWYGYEGVDAVVLASSRPEIFANLRADDPRLRALDEWIRMGGRLVWCIGARAADVLGERSPLRQFTPGRLVGMELLRQTGALEAYCRSSVAVPRPAGGAAPLEIRAPRLADVSGVVEVREADLPLVIRSPRGFGQVVVLAADLDQGPLAAWADRGLLVAKLLDLSTSRVEDSQANAPLMHYGYTDLAGQLRSALDRFEGVRLTPFWAVAGLLVLYVLAIGPLDYFLLRRFARRMIWTWLTFPAVVLGFCLLAYGVACWAKGDQVRVHQVELIDVDVAASRARGTVWLSVFSPRSEPYNLALRPQLPRIGRETRSADAKGTVPSSPSENWDTPPDARVLLSWFGLPGTALGGMSARASEPVPRRTPYDFSPPLDRIEGLPVQVWSSKSLTARWTATIPMDSMAELVEENQLPIGPITNPLPFPLAQCVLAYDRWLYILGTLEAGQAAYLTPESRRSELKTYLTGYRLVFESKDKSRQVATPYEQSSTDPAYILRAMMFFDDSGGQRYTGLANRYQRFVDLSGLLRTRRAVLVGLAPPCPAGATCGSELTRDGRPLPAEQQEKMVVYRFVLPVERAEKK